MDGYATYDEAIRRRAAALFDEGLGYKAAASLLGIPRETVRKWLDIYRSVGIEVLAMMGKKHTAVSANLKLTTWDCGGNPGPNRNRKEAACTALSRERSR